MSSVNKVILLGNVGKDPEIRSTQDGKRIANLSIATSESWKDKATGQRKEKTEWHRVVVFNDGLVGVIDGFVKKGSKVYLEGQLQTRKWTDNAGVEKYSTEVVLQGFGGSMVLLDSRSVSTEEKPQASSYQSNPSYHAQAPDLDDEIPF